ncbi:MAG: DEAD/DEAH box helicase [Mesorhizobium sp.]|nr:MAG: DEAD/DEAH box helicase [Mesorhizobium sp.]
MFTISELEPCLSQKWFSEGYSLLERNTLLRRLGMKEEALPPRARRRFKHFSQAVIASAINWDNPREGAARRLCQIAGDIEASFSLVVEDSQFGRHLAMLKAVLLYDLAGLPGASASYSARNGFDPRFRDFFTRSNSSPWGTLAETGDALQARVQPEPELSHDWTAWIDQCLGGLAQEAGVRLQGGEADQTVEDRFAKLAEIGGNFELGVTGDDILALGRLVNLREANSALKLIPSLSLLDEADIRALSMPVELWPAQATALKDGLLDRAVQSFGFAAPTGTGKTALTRLLIADALASDPARKVLYICPSRALVHQVAADLYQALQGIGLSVVEAGAHLIDHERIPLSSEAEVLVFTPERADMLLRVDQEFLDKVCLVIVDEAHHIEQGSRGVLLEFYLWRLRKLIPSDARIVQLSAVAPNIAELTDWLSPEKSSRSVMLDWRTSRLRVGILERGSRGAALLSFGEGTPYQLLPDGALPSNAKEGIATLANRLSKSGIVLVLCVSPGSAETVARLVSSQRSTIQPTDDEVSERLDAWTERELYAESELRDHYKKRVVFHHAQLPPRVRAGIEDAIREKKVDVICATTTLAEGVNFPFSTVLVESLVGTTFEISPRSLWNIAGRAGRFGVDTEGHCIIYRPDWWAHNLKEYRISDYLKSNLPDIPPVRSALATGIERLQELVETGKIGESLLDAISLSDIKVDGKSTAAAKEVRALVNIMRVGYAHAGSTGAIDLDDETSPEFARELLASRQLGEDERRFAEKLGFQQRRVIQAATKSNPEFVSIAARVGWSLEAQQNLYDWLETRDNWQLEQFGNSVIAGHVRSFENLGYLLGPLAKYLIAFEGEALGGQIAFLAVKWIRGIPLSSFQEERGTSFGKLISNVYGRMQYLLPWGLFGMHELLQFESKQRGLAVGDGVSSLSVLAAEGVPNFDALTLVLGLGVERVDAARLSIAYAKMRSAADVSGWFAGLSWTEVERIVRGQDQRRIDPLLRTIHSRLHDGGSVN